MGSFRQTVMEDIITGIRSELRVRVYYFAGNVYELFGRVRLLFLTLSRRDKVRFDTEERARVIRPSAKLTRIGLRF